MNLPLVRAFAEEHEVTATEDGCRFTWTFAFEAGPGFGPLVKLGLPATGFLRRFFARDTKKTYGTAAILTAHTR